MRRIQVTIHHRNQRASVDLDNKILRFKDPRIINYVIHDDEIDEIMRKIQPIVERVINKKMLTTY